MLEALKDLGILLSSLVIVVVARIIVIGQKIVQTLKRGILPILYLMKKIGASASYE
jgi:hypothetical protein